MSAPVRLACVTTSAALGGAETSLFTLLSALRRLEPEWAITVVAPADGPFNERCRASGIAVVEVPFPPALAALGESGAAGVRRRSANQLRLAADAVRSVAALPAYLRALRRALEACGASVIHTNGVKAHIAGALAKPRGTRLVWHLHEYVRARPLTARLLRSLARRADAMVANSQSVLEDARQAFGAAAPLTRVYNAVDLSVFTPDGPRVDLASLAGLTPDSGLVKVGLVATFGRWKGQDVFIEAVSRLKADRQVRAYVVGGPVYETAGSQWSLEELRRRAAASGLNGSIGFTGHVADVPAVLRALDVVVHASTQPEPFGMVIAEGMATARGVVAVRAGGAAELFEDGVDAVGFAPGDAAGLASRIRELAADAAGRERLAAAARRSAAERFSAERMAAEFRKVYLG